MQVFKVRVNQNRCTGCNVCVVSCPINFKQLKDKGKLTEENAVILVRNGIAIPIYDDERTVNCDGCGVCMKACPQVAMDIKIIEEE